MINSNNVSLVKFICKLYFITKICFFRKNTSKTQKRLAQFYIKARIKVYVNRTIKTVCCALKKSKTVTYREYMKYTVFKASFLKRIAAALLDVIVLCIVITGVAALTSWATGYNKYNAQLEERSAYYQEKYDIKIDITAEEYKNLSEEDKLRYDQADEEFSKDEIANKAYQMILSLSLVILSISILVAYVVVDFVLPLIFKNGQTLGKKIFGIAVMHTNGVKIKAEGLFIRTILGKYTIETMIFVLVAVMAFFNILEIGFTALAIGIIILELALLLLTQYHTPIHDVFAKTITVDLTSQKIFNNEQELVEYKQQLAKEEAERKTY